MSSFTKMHGLGNDFVFIDGRNQSITLSKKDIQRLSDRRFGIGCDQLLVLEAPKNPEADIFMRIYNADGTEAGACGNATRCLGALLAEKTGHARHVIETVSGLLETHHKKGITRVNMGVPKMDWRSIPLSEDVDTLFLPIAPIGMEAPVAVSMGNPHLIFFVKEVEAVDLERLGAELTHHPLFPQGTNVEIVEIKTPGIIRMRVWERGTGITLACASGACAAVVAGVRRGLLDPSVLVHLDGGDLSIHYQETVWMEGPTTLSFEGSFKSGILL